MLRLAMGALAVLAAGLVGPSEAGAQRSNPGSEWRAGLEMGSRPGLVAAWERFSGPWSAGAALAVGPGEDPVLLRATPHVRLGGALGNHLRLAAGLGLEWARLEGGGNRDESEIFWEVAAGWRTTGALLLEAGIRWTDFAEPRRRGVLRVSAPLSVTGPEAGASERAPELAPVPRDLGVPDEVASEGLLSMRVPTAERVGGGVRLLASNPHGDPDPSAPGANANVDRLAMAGDVWGRRGSWRSWASWRSDLHVDASISDRTKAVAEGLSFPTSVSFSGGAAWRPEAGEGLEVAVRHAPQLLLWMPHLSSERTAGATVGKGVFEHRGAALELEGGRIRAIAGRTVDPLSHFRGVFTGPSMRRFRLGFEHERLTILGDVDARTRLVLGMDGPVRLRVGAGSDLVVQMDREGRSGRWVTSGRAWMRSRPEPLNLDELLRRGWSTETAAVPAPETGWLGGAHVVVGRGPLALEVRGLFHEPVWTPAAVSRADGGWVEATWADTVSFVELKGRARVASWGPETAWWNEAPSVSGRAGAHGDLGSARIRGWVQFRSRIRSDRSQRSEPAGFELGLGTDVPLPDLGSSRGITARMELDDVLDVGLLLRPGAPRRGRRLTVVLTWDLTGAP